MHLRLASSVFSRGLMAAVFAFVSLAPAVRAQQSDDHLVSPTQLQQQVQSAAAARQQNIDTLTKFLSSPAAIGKMKAERIDARQVQSAIPNLSDAELASLSARASQAEQQFAAGSLSNNDLLLIILVLVIVIAIAVIR